MKERHKAPTAIFLVRPDGLPVRTARTESPKPTD